jgi:hypothetical protein
MLLQSRPSSTTLVCVSFSSDRCCCALRSAELYVGEVWIMKQPARCFEQRAAECCSWWLGFGHVAGFELG